MSFRNEFDFEKHIRELIQKEVTDEHPNIYALKNKKAVDILICKDDADSELFY